MINGSLTGQAPSREALPDPRAFFRQYRIVISNHGSVEQAMRIQAATGSSCMNEFPPKPSSFGRLCCGAPRVSRHSLHQPSMRCRECYIVACL
jgi:hypothetical protein